MNNSEKDNITKKDILAKLLANDRTFVLFYAKWCGFSRSFLPVFEEFSKDNPNDCIAIAFDDNPDICKEYSINYYPTVIQFSRGKVQKRLDSKPGIGLDKKEFEEFTKI